MFASGVMVPPVEETTRDNFDLQFGTQVVGHYLFATLLYAALKEGARSPPVSLPGGSRIVHLTSVAAFEHPRLDFATFVDGPTCRGRGTKDLYRQSKFVRIFPFFLVITDERLSFWTRAQSFLHRKWPADGQTTVSSHS
jgi:NAD(P)-dependent dehydrogenase (short-subunit alcohol dehydrogenase family)